MRLSFRAIASRLQIGVGSAYRLYKRFVTTGELSPSKRASRPETRKLDDLHELYRRVGLSSALRYLAHIFY